MRKEYIQILQLLHGIHKTEREMSKMLKNQSPPPEFLEEIHKNLINAVEEINETLYSDPRPMFLNESLEKMSDPLRWEEGFPVWQEIVLAVIYSRNKLSVIDKEFQELMDFVSASTEEVLVEFAGINLMLLREADQESYWQIKNFYEVFQRFWGQVDLEQEKISALQDRAFQLKAHQQDFIWLYQRLADYRSKKVLTGILNYWLTYDLAFLAEIRENNFSDYFDLDLVWADENEVFVDAGAWVGDSSREFIQTFGEYKKIYCFEITPESLEKCRSEFAHHKNVEIVPKALGQEPGTMYLAYQGLDHSGNALSVQGEHAVEVVRLDDEIAEPITWLKMDIEGAEKDALLGARRHIAEESPKLTICTYHSNEDIWKIPRLIDEINPNYRFYMRYHGKMQGATEFLIYALPERH